MYLRFVRPLRIPFLKARAGFFDAAYELRRVKTLDQFTADRLEDNLAWFRENLPIPKVFSRSSSKRPDRDRDGGTPGLSWFKDDATEALDHAFDLIALLNDAGFTIETLRSDRVGYIIYEDTQQVVAEPFANTPV